MSKSGYYNPVSATALDLMDKHVKYVTNQRDAAKRELDKCVSEITRLDAKISAYDKELAALKRDRDIMDPPVNQAASSPVAMAPPMPAAPPSPPSSYTPPMVAVPAPFSAPGDYER